jgi:hypothetical protein
MPEPDLIPLPPASTPEPSPPEAPTPMLDVHPAHHAANTWRDFFVHIATIVLGLLIAISLEQTVEYFHHRHLASEARELLRVERNKNRTSLAIDIYTTQRHQDDLRRDLSILHSLKTHTPLLNQPFILRRFSYGFFSEAWKNIHESGTVNYLSAEDLQALDYLYELQNDFTGGVRDSGITLAHAASVLTGQTGGVRTELQSVASAQFVDAIGANNGVVDETTAERGYAPLVEHPDLSLLVPADLDSLERAIKIAIVNDDSLLATSFDIKRVLDDRLAQDK